MTFGLAEMEKYLSKEMKSTYDLPNYVFKEVPKIIVRGMEEALRRGDKVRLERICILEPIVKKERFGRNPVNGEKIFIPEHKGLKYKTSDDIINKLNEAESA